MSLTYPEAVVVGALQGVSELFPVSSLGHAVLVPALVGGRWAADLDVSAPESPYLAFIVGLHVATALALIVFYRRDWARIIGGFLGSLRARRMVTPEARLAWLLVLATIPVGVTGLRWSTCSARRWAVRCRPPPSSSSTASSCLPASGCAVGRPSPRRPAGGRSTCRRGGKPPGPGRRPGGLPPEAPWRTLTWTRSTRRPADRPRRFIVGASQILALLPGISRSGVTMVAGLVRGLSHEDAARFSFLLATPVILAAGVLKLPDLFGPLGEGIRGQVLVGSAVSFVAAYAAVRWLTRWFQTRTLTPFAIYSLVAGALSLIVLVAR